MADRGQTALFASSRTDFLAFLALASASASAAAAFRPFFFRGPALISAPFASAMAAARWSAALKALRLVLTFLHTATCRSRALAENLRPQSAQGIS